MLEDLFVRDSSDVPLPLAYGRGIEAAGGTVVMLSRARFVRSRDMALFVYGPGARIEGGDVVVRDVESNLSGVFGRAIHAQQSAAVALERVELGNCREATVTASGAGTSITLADATIEATRPRACAADTCPSAGAGIGVSSQHEASIDLQRFRIADHALCGVQLSQGGQVDLDDGVVEHNPVGANVQTDAFDVARLTRRVVYRDNGMNLDSTELVVPDSSPPGT